MKSDGPSGHAGCAIMTGADVPEFALKPTVYVVDDDARIREALDEMLTLAGMGVVTCASAGDYFRVPKPDLPSCVILDVALPGGSGIDLQRQLSTEDHPPIIFLTSAGDIPTCVRAIKAGAIDFLTKPCRKTDLLAAIETAIAQDCHLRAERAERMRLKYRHSCLTPRERGSPAAGCRRSAQQTGRRQARHQRNHASDSPQPRHAQDGSRITR